MPVVGGMFLGFLVLVAVLCERDMGLVCLLLYINRDGVVVLRLVGFPGEGAVVGVLQAFVGGYFEYLAFVLVSFALPFALPGDGAAHFPVRGDGGPEHVLLDFLWIDERLPNAIHMGVDGGFCGCGEVGC